MESGIYNDIFKNSLPAPLKLAWNETLLIKGIVDIGTDLIQHFEKANLNITAIAINGHYIDDALIYRST